MTVATLIPRYEVKRGPWAGLRIPLTLVQDPGALSP